MRLLASILRVADGLDRTNRQIIQAVRVRIQSKDIELTLAAPLGSDLELELWSARRKADLMEEVFRRKVRFTTTHLPPGTSDGDPTTLREESWQPASARSRDHDS